jgi:hypothetical protein
VVTKRYFFNGFRESAMGGIDLNAVAMKTRIGKRALRHVWDLATEFDDSLGLKPNLITALAARRVTPARFSRSVLFQNMRLCQPSLFFDVNVHPRLSGPELRRFSLLDELRCGLPRSALARVQTRKSEHFAPLSNILDRWQRADSVFGVIDLHYIGTRFDLRMDTTELNDFNLLPRGDDRHQSQDSIVISTAGAVTDSHSDDHSGSNHCFVGSKLWLLWDTFEGFEYGLEDWGRCEVDERAAFDLSAFLAMKSSRWILIGPKQTMFIPAHLTHKVITLRPYLGLGIFHAGLPGFVDLLMRWTRLAPLWAFRSKRNPRCSVEFLTHRAMRKVESLRGATKHERFQWGVMHLRERLRQPDTSDDFLEKSFAPQDLWNLKDFIRAARRLESH